MSGESSVLTPPIAFATGLELSLGVTAAATTLTAAVEAFTAGGDVIVTGVFTTDVFVPGAGVTGAALPLLLELVRGKLAVVVSALAGGTAFSAFADTEFVTTATPAAVALGVAFTTVGPRCRDGGIRRSWKRVEIQRLDKQ